MIIKRRHPRYSQRINEWLFFKKAYLGGRDYIGPDTLHRYFKEGEGEYADRLKRAYRENHVKRIVNIINSYLFKVPASRNTSNALLGEFFKNVDGKNKSLSQFMKHCSIWSAVYGRVYIALDKTRLPEEMQTGTQADNLAAQIYTYMIEPQDMLDIAFDTYGNIKWALVHETIRNDDDPFDYGDNLTGRDEASRFRLWTKDACYVYDENGGEVETIEHRLGIVPIIVLNYEEKDIYDGGSMIGDIAYIDRSIFNNWSRLDVVINDQTFSQFIFPVEASIVDLIENPKMRDDYFTLATNRVLLYSAQSGVAPAFVSPDASQAAFILEVILKQIEKLYAVQGLQGEVGTEVKAAASGVSKAYDFDKLNKMLADKADNLEDAEKRIAAVFGAWLGVNDIDADIDYPDEFEARSLADEIALAGDLAALDISRLFKAEIDKQVVTKALPKADNKTLNAIKSEIEANSKEPEPDSPAFDFERK